VFVGDVALAFLCVYFLRSPNRGGVPVCVHYFALLSSFPTEQSSAESAVSIKTVIYFSATLTKMQLIFQSSQRRACGGRQPAGSSVESQLYGLD